MKIETKSRCIAAGVLLALLFSLAAMAPAQEQTFELDPAKTTVRFTLGDVLHTVHGTFKTKSGTVRFDPSSGTASGAIVVDATSGDSGNSTRDHKMHKEILESGKYPEITFSPNRIVGTVTGGSTIQVEGIFRIHGADHPLTLAVPIAMGGGNLTASLHFTVPYVAWGMKNPSTFILRVNKEVEIDIVAVGHLTAAPPPR
jgi:polyisoprenoid-binding protein YceI